jgi:hypothetical protein
MSTYNFPLQRTPPLPDFFAHWISSEVLRQEKDKERKK